MADVQPADQAASNPDNGTPAPETEPASPADASPPAQADRSAGSPPDPAPASAGEPTLAQAPPEENEPAPAPTNWPENWRDIAAGGDPKMLSMLNRYASPANVAKALASIRSKMDAGEMVRTKPDGEDADALNEWRAQAGIPETPEGYLEKLPDGLVVGEEDRAIVDTFVKSMHESDAPPEYVHKALGWYYGHMEEVQAQRAEGDRTQRQTAEDDLRSEFGPEFRPNLNGVHNMLDAHAPEGFKDRLFSARFADGTLIGDDPETIEFLVGLNREINPYGTVTPNAGQTPLQTIQSELAELRKEMGDKDSDYYHSEEKQARYRELIDLETRARK